MAMSPCERKRAQRARADGYAKSREADWKAQGIIGASYVEYLEMIVNQHSECCICRGTIDSTSPLDHDHNTGMVRSVLCLKCNLVLGHIEAGNRTPTVLRNAASYLELFNLS